MFRIDKYWAGALAMLVVGLSAACGPKPSLQRDWGVYRVEATREDLNGLRTQFQQGAQSQGYSPELRNWARGEASAVQDRLREGDLGVGDRIVLSVERVPSLSDTFIVATGQALELPSVGQVALAGVLRSELEEYLTAEVGRFVNDPVLRATSYVRVSVTGDVNNPGFYLFSPEMPVSEAIMVAGGPTANANIKKVRVDRGEEWIMRGGALQVAIGDGQTIGELGLHSGDYIHVPRQSALATGQAAQTLLVVSGLVIALTQITR